MQEHLNGERLALFDALDYDENVAFEYIVGL
jgi:hypothetical protein